MTDKNLAFQVFPIGTIHRDGDQISIHIDEAYRPGLEQLDQFSHVMVFWWAGRFDTEQYRQMLQMEPPYAPGHVHGVFATRSPYRPNPVAMTTCKLLGLDKPQAVDLTSGGKPVSIREVVVNLASDTIPTTVEG